MDLLARSGADTEGEYVVNFESNIATEGTTIYAIGSEMIIDTIRMAYNYGNEGGCLHFVNTDVHIRGSLFARNKAIQGGVIFAI